ncbi:MAG: PPOX class F420-dependent oxidoreductase [Acidimicrobiales bacterium]|nr:PPOX class F420-dependent oxidoreductase [Acidimicrobiales bacterium]
MNSAPTADDARALLVDHHRAILVTRRRDGSLQISPVTAGVDSGGRVVVSSREPAYKVKNLRRDPRSSLCVLSDEFFGPWLQIDGRAEIVSLPEAMEGLVDYYRQVAGEHPDWNDYRAAMERERRVLIRIDIERVGPAASG